MKDNKLNNPATAAVGIAILALAVRLVTIGDKSIFVDEAVTIYLSIRPVGEVLPFMMRAGEVHPPLYFWFISIWLKIWNTIGGMGTPSEFFLRVTSAVMGAGSVYVTYLIGARIYRSAFRDNIISFFAVKKDEVRSDEKKNEKDVENVNLEDPPSYIKIPLFATLLMALSTYHTVYSQELRMYPMLLLFMALGLLYFIKSVEKPSVLNLMLMVVFSALAYLSHYFGLFTIMIGFIFLVYSYFYSKKAVNDDDKDYNEKGGGDQEKIEFLSNGCKKMLVSGAASLIALFIWIPYFLKQTGHQDFMMRTNPSVKMLFTLFSRMTYGYNLSLPTDLTEYAYAGLALVPLALVFFALFKNREPGDVFAGIWLFAPLLATLAVSLSRFHVFEYKYFFIITPALWLLVSSGITALDSRYLKGLLLVFIIGFNLYTGFNFHFNPYYQGQDWRSAVKFVESNKRPGEMVVVNPSMMSLAFYHYHGVKNPDPVMPMDYPDPNRLGPAFSNNRGVWAVSTVHHPYVEQTGLLRYLKETRGCIEVQSLESYERANIIKIFYCPPQQGKRALENEEIKD